MALNLTDEQLERILISALESNPYFLEICELVRVNATGNVWLIGGAVSRTLAAELYGTVNDSKKFDFDFVTDGELVDDEIIPDGWSVSYAKFGNPTFTKDGTDVSVDLWPLQTHEYLRSKGKEPTIDNFLEVVPYTIQSLVYNIKTGELRGEKGIIALRRKEFCVNNLDYAQIEASRKGQTVHERMERKAKSMGFSVNLSQ